MTRRGVVHSLFPSLQSAEWWNPIREDPRFDEMLELFDSKETHTEQYLRDHDLEAENRRLRMEKGILKKATVRMPHHFFVQEKS